MGQVARQRNARYQYRNDEERWKILEAFLEEAWACGKDIAILASEPVRSWVKAFVSEKLDPGSANDQHGRLRAWGPELFVDDLGVLDFARLAEWLRSQAKQATVAGRGLAVAVDLGCLAGAMPDPSKPRCEQLLERLPGECQTDSCSFVLLCHLDTEASILTVRSKLYEGVFRYSPAAILVLRPAPGGIDFEVFDLNPAAARELGLEDQAAVGQAVSALLPRSLVQDLIPCIEAVWRDGKARTVESGAALASRGKRWIRCHCFKVPPDYIVVLCEDITDYVSNAEALGETAEHLDALIRTCPVPVVGVDVEDRVIVWNPAAERTFGWRSEEVIGKPIPWVPEGLESESERNRRLQAAGVSFKGDVFTRKRKDGALVEVALYTAPLHDREGRLVGATGVALDVTEIRRLQRALRESEERYRRVVETAQEGVWLGDHEGRTTMVNAFLAGLLGYSPEELIGRPLTELVAREDVSIVEELLDHLREGKTAGGDVHLLRRDASVVDVHLSMVPLVEGDGSVSGLLATVFDLSAQRQLEHERLRSAKLESLGVLAGGLAHDFNNLLTGILGNLSFAREAEDPQEKAELLVAAEDAAQRAIGLTRQLLTFSRGGVPVKKSGSIRELLEKSVSFILAGSRVLPVFDLRETFFVEFDPPQMEQVFQNLTVNAKEAMEAGGRLYVCTRDVVDEQGRKLVEISFRDEGTGIPLAIMDKVFDPYFTTKPEGTGLGLAIVHSVVTRHGGHVRVDSERGKGTTIRIYLPASEASSSAEQAAGRDAEEGSLYGGRILVVDDERAIRVLLERIIKSLGMEVESFAEGSSACLRYEEALREGQPFDIVITDLTMPGGMSGEEVIRRIRSCDPNATVVVSSGYADEPVMANARAYGADAALEKPYTLASVKDLIMRLLREREHRPGEHREK